MHTGQLNAQFDQERPSRGRHGTSDYWAVAVGLTQTSRSSELIPQLSWRLVLAYWLVTLIIFGLYLAYVQPLRDFLAPDIYLDLRFDGYDHAEAVTFFDKLGMLDEPSTCAPRFSIQYGL